MNDLFLTKEQQLKNWMRFKKYFTSHEVMRWGLDNMYIRSDRTKRDFMEKGIIRKLTDSEKNFCNYNGKDAMYAYVEKKLIDVDNSFQIVNQ